jgi:hypothetical protein
MAIVNVLTYDKARSQGFPSCTFVSLVVMGFAY